MKPFFYLPLFFKDKNTYVFFLYHKKQLLSAT